ncbi:SIS domain-containing protein [Obesumbacterium proteus]|uniref:SIS domain-containing protein n=1 Tax=Obesumbacterium proteus TaxID=82983 RepID=UPI0010350D4B|nr:SIS domain-containing protein [Obesumbacterium proteus]TBL73406.1 SIS domain-containing protein [Obesumbacterium proteus]
MKPTMMTYIHEEREVLANILQHYPAALPSIAHKKEWLILATGSSINAAKSAKHYIEHIANTRITIEEPFNYQHYEKHNPAVDLVIGVSQSGESTSTINAIEYLKSHYPLTSYGVTSKPHSELSKIVDFTVDIHIGEERVGYVTKGYVATILTLMLIGLRSAAVNGIISKEREDAELAMLKYAVEQIPYIIDDTEAFYRQWQNELNSAPRFTTIAYGPNVGTCKEMETKFSETVRVPSQGIELESFMHGPYFEVNAQHRIFFIEVDSIAQERLSLLRNYEKQHTDYIYTVKLGMDDNPRTLAINAEIHELVSPLVLVIPFQILAHHIAEAKGNNLPQRIFTDFGVAMKSKTKPGDYA